LETSMPMTCFCIIYLLAVKYIGSANLVKYMISHKRGHKIPFGLSQNSGEAESLGRAQRHKAKVGFSPLLLVQHLS
jgi:hypothetical protein